MEYQYINRLAQFGKVEYDILITTNLGSYRSSVKFDIDNDNDEAKEQKAIELANQFDSQTFEKNSRKSIEHKVSIGGEFMKAYIEAHPSITIEQYIQINSLVNNALSSLGIVLPSPDIRSVLKTRVDDSINNIKDELSTMEIESDTEAKVNTALATILGALQ